MDIFLVIALLAISMTSCTAFTKEDISQVQITPYKQAIVLLGQTISIDVYNPGVGPFCIKIIPKTKASWSTSIRIRPDESCFQNESSNNNLSPEQGQQYLYFQLTGLKPGRQELTLLIYDNRFTNGTAYILSNDYEVIVSEQLNVIHDAFIYILGSIQFLALLLLGLRMRGAATKEIIVNPCALISALLCQVICLPLVSLLF